ncbi:MAG TPA: hypothetical protein VKA73_17050 [Rubrobacter sp.]|nr:hypothetical protein [Rubrobacter sp.]
MGLGLALRLDLPAEARPSTSMPVSSLSVRPGTSGRIEPVRAATTVWALSSAITSWKRG